MDKIKCIYAIKDKRNDKVIYIGQTKDFNKRVKSHKYENRCKIDKYITEQGRDYFEMYIVEKLLENLSKEEILNKEQFYINLYDTHKNGFNVFNSGNSVKNREETKERQEYRKRYLYENKEILKEKRQKKYQENKEEILAKQRDKYQKNKEEILAKKKDKYYSNHEEALDYYRERRKIKKQINATIYNT